MIRFTVADCSIFLRRHGFAERPAYDEVEAVFGSRNLLSQLGCSGQGYHRLQAKSRCAASSRRSYTVTL